MPPPYFRIHPRSAIDLVLTCFFKPASMPIAWLPIWYLGNTVLKHVLHKNHHRSNRSLLTIYVIVFYASFSPALEVQKSVIFYYTFTKFLTIHKENCNQMYYQWCSLNDRSEVYSKRYSCLSKTMVTHRHVTITISVYH